MHYEKCICDNYEASTFAVSEKQARNNLAYRFKTQYGLVLRTRIALPGKLICTEGSIIDGQQLQMQFE